jgi:hypothetical protein
VILHHRSLTPGRASCRDKARKEQEQLAAELGEEAEQMSSKFISQLNYMDACMKESVRKYSTLLLVRLAMQDVCFTTADGQEFLLPQGTLSRTRDGRTRRMHGRGMNSRSLFLLLQAAQWHFPHS